MTEKERKDLKVGDRVLFEHKSYKYMPATVMQIADPLTHDKEPIFLLQYGLFERQKWTKAYYVVAKLNQ